MLFEFFGVGPSLTDEQALAFFFLLILVVGSVYVKVSSLLWKGKHVVKPPDLPCDEELEENRES